MPSISPKTNSNFVKTTKNTPKKLIINPYQCLLSTISPNNFEANIATIIGCKAIINALKEGLTPRLIDKKTPIEKIPTVRDPAIHI